MSNSLTALVIVVTVIHVVAIGVMAAIRLWPTGVIKGEKKATPCAVCGEPSTHRSYDGLDPNEQRDPHTGRAWSDDLRHYRPACAAH